MMTAAQKIAETCSVELATLMWFGNAFLWVSFITAVLVTLLSVVERVVALRKAPAAGEAGGADVSTILDSLKGLIVALGQAPAWFAIFLAAMLLLWAAPMFFGTKCVLVQTPQGQAAPAGANHSAGPPPATPVRGDLKHGRAQSRSAGGK